MPARPSCDHSRIHVAQDRQETVVTDDRLEELLADAREFFEARLWETEGAGSARAVLAKEGLGEEVIRAFGVGYAPADPEALMEHLGGLGYTTDEIVASGLLTRSHRGRVHPQFHSRIMFPVRDRDGRILGFAGMGTHLGPSWPLWVTSPDVGLYRRSEAVFGLDRAAATIERSRSAQVQRDCIEVLRLHQDGGQNAVSINTSAVTRAQVEAIAADLLGGVDGLDVRFGQGMRAETEEDVPTPSTLRSKPEAPREPPRHLKLKRYAIVIATAFASVNLATGAPVLALWIGSQVQPGRLLSIWGVVTVIAVMGVMAFLVGLALVWLSAKYDELTGRPHTARETSPWHRAKRGDRVQDIRTRFGISAPEKAIAAVVILAMLALQVWFFLYAGSPFT
ncbi:MAG: hypothetical protein ACXWZV_07695 [Solirubrobacterales bacterium]